MPFQMRFRMLFTLLLSLIVPAGSASVDMCFNFENCYKLLIEKKAAYPDYRKAKDEMQELLRAQRNVELFFAEEKNTTEKTQSR